MMAKKKENTSVKQNKKETAEANDSRKSAKKQNTQKVKIIKPVAWLLLPYKLDQIKELPIAQAQELIDLGCAEKA